MLLTPRELNGGIVKKKQKKELAITDPFWV